MLNEKALNGLYDSNPTARVILRELSTMARQDETNLDKLEDRLLGKGKEVDRRELVKIFKLLQHFNVGEFIPCRRGHPSRVRWGVNSVRIGAVDVSLPETIAGKQALAAVTAEVPDFAQPTVHISHRFQLRPDLSITLQLPSDLTPAEAQRLSTFVSALSFVGGGGRYS